MTAAIGMKQYRAVVTLAEERHFGRAARRLGVTQPALSMALARLEQALGVVLFVREGEVRPTAAGAAFLREAVEVVRAAERAVAAVAPAKLGFPVAVRRFSASHPEIKVTVTTGGGAEQEAALRDGRLDVAFCYLPADAAFVLFPRPPAAHSTDVVKSLRAKERWRPAALHCVDHSQAALALVAAGVGLSILPGWVVGKKPVAFAFRPLPWAEVSAPAGLASRADGGAAARAFCGAAFNVLTGA